MKELTQLFRSLKKNEKRTLVQLHKAQYNQKKTKRQELLNLLKLSRTWTDEEAAWKLYKAKPNSAFSHLKKRLKHDIMMVMLLQDKKEVSDTEFMQRKYECRRMLTSGELLLSRGASLYATKLLQQALTIADTYELYGEKMLITDLLRNHLGYRRGLKSYSTYTVELKQAVDVMDKVLEARNYHNHILLPNLFRKNQERQMKDYAQEAQETLKRYYQDTSSPTIGYYYYYASIFHSEIVKDYEAALKYSHNLLQLIEEEPAIYSRTRSAGANLQLAVMLIYTGSYTESTRYSYQALQLFRSGLLNELTALEVLYYGSFYSGTFAKAEEAVQKALSHQKLKSNKLLPAKWLFFRANLELAQGQHVKALRTLAENTELSKDKSGWWIGYRLLELMALLEADDGIVMEYKLENLRKLLQRQKKMNVNRPSLIASVWDSLIKSDFDFVLTEEKKDNELQLLSANDTDYNWNPMGYELIRFDEWFRKKTHQVHGTS